MLNKFAEELKEARIKSELTLEQIAAKTRIDLKFLEAIENGNFHFLPELYVKAFLREYFNLVGLDEQTSFKKFEAAKKGKQYDELGNTEDDQKKTKLEKEEPKLKQPIISSIPTYETSESTRQTQEGSSKIDKKNMMIAAISGGVVIIFLIIYFVFIKGSSDIVVTEKPYSEVQSESTQRYTQENITPQTSDSTYVASSDSLSLIIETNDTSWIKILLDGTRTEEFNLLPHAVKEIKSLKNFQIIIGNAAAVQIKLNNKNLNFTGNKHEVKFISVDSTGLKYLTTPLNF